MNSINVMLIILGLVFVPTNAFLIALSTIHTQYQITFQSKFYRTFLALITLLNISGILYLAIVTNVDLLIISLLLLQIIHYGGCIRVIENQLNQIKQEQ